MLAILKIITINVKLSFNYVVRIWILIFGYKVSAIQSCQENEVGRDCSANIGNINEKRRRSRSRNRDHVHLRLTCNAVLVSYGSISRS
jgi:hypothetical protein